MAALDDRRVLIMTTNFGTESDELTVPVAALREAGATVTVAASSPGVVKTLEGDRDPGPEVPVDTTYDQVKAADFDALVIPGGTLNADQLRADEAAQQLVRAFGSAAKPVAAICHAPWLLVDAGLADGRDLTSVPTIRTDLVNAGASWADREVVVDDAGGYPLITSRTPEDLDAFNAAIIDALG